LDTVSGEWLRCSPESIRNFSAVGYYFGRELHQDLQVPIGLINTSWGGTPTDAWTERSRIEADPILKPIVDRHERQLAQYPEAFKKYQQKLDEMKAQGITQYHTDPGNIGLKSGWNKTEFDDSSWKTMKLPCLWESNNYPIDGVFWFRKTIDIPNAWSGKTLDLSLDLIDDFDISYFNGVQVGATGEENKNAWRTPRNYTIPAKLVKPGKAVITIRVFDRFGGGGIYGSPAKMFVSPVGAKTEDRINIAGDWKYHVAHKLDPKPRVQMPRAPYGENHPYSMSGLFNAMIHPLIPFAIKGAIWYQGESNAGRAWQYRTLLPVMIECWRQEWNQGDFPFLIVQLANFRKPNDKPVDSSWAELREAQALTVEKLSNCGLAVAIDIGESDDIHPKNKQDVGKRLAQAALKIAYGQDVVYSGPAYLSHEINRDKIIVQFKHAGGGLVAKNGKLQRFQIAGEDKKFVWADAVIDGTKVIVSSPEVKVPVAVRYAWSDNPEGCNLYNKEGLPAVPFRTDTWEGVTDKNR
jgi:sialate O-acetylesterase